MKSHITPIHTLNGAWNIHPKRKPYIFILNDTYLVITSNNTPT